MICAIIGDIVGSRNIIDPLHKTHEPDPIRQALQVIIKETLNQINEEYASDIIIPFEIWRGDGIEGIVKPTCRFPEIAMQIIRAVYPTKIRFAFGIGNISAMLDNGSVFASDGSAMHFARDALNQLEKVRKDVGWFNMIFAAETDNKFTNASLLINALLTTLASITDGWTEKQLQTVWTIEDYAGSRGKQKKAALKLGVTSPAITYSLKNSNYKTYKMAWNALIEYLALETIDLE